jgi:hypothetical protein
MNSHHLPGCALAVTLVVGVSACRGDRNPPRADTAGALSTGIFPTPHQTHFVEYPVEGVDLGQGWHREGVSKAVATCIDFTSREDTGQEQSMQLTVVTDSSALMETLDVSAEAQFKAISFSVSGKARYAKDTDVRSNSLNVLAHARVMNGVEYVAPAARGAQQGRIDLTLHYRDLARRDRVAFEQECGDGFVAALYSGAELTAMLSFDESSTTKRTEIEAAMSGSGWGFSAESKAMTEMKTAASSKKLRVTFYQTGGSGSPIPTTQEGFVGAIEHLPMLAAKDPYNYRILVQSYRSLPGYPSGTTDERDEFRQVLATSYGRLLTLRLAAIEALEAPGSYVDSHADQSRPAMQKRMQTLHDELVTKLRCIRGLADSYTYYDEDMGPRETLAVPCTLTTDLDLRNDYEYRLRLPVLSGNVAGKAASDINAAVIDHHVRDVSRRRCERDLEDPGCLLEGEIEELRKRLST